MSYSLRPLIVGVMIMSVTVFRTGLAAEPETTPKRPSRPVWSPRFSPDGTKLATAHGDWEQATGGEVRIWDATSGKPLFVLPTEHGVRSVAWSPKGDIIAAGTYGKAVHFFDPQAGTELGQMPLEANVEGVLFSPDEQRLITSFNSGSIIVWKLPQATPLHNFHLAHKGGVWGLAQSLDGKRLASAGADGYVRIYDLENLKVLHELKHPAATNGVAFTPDGTKLVSGCHDALIRVFDVASGVEEHQLAGHEARGVTELQFSSNGNLLASAGMDLTVRIWGADDLGQWKLTETLKAHDKFAFGVAISPQDDLLASAGWDGQIHVRDLATRKEKWSHLWAK